MSTRIQITRVREFIQKCKKKALNSMEVKYQDLYPSIIEEFLNSNPKIKELMISLDSTAEKYNTLIKLMNEELKDESKFRYEHRWIAYPQEIDFKNHFEQYLKVYMPKDSVIEDFKTKWMKEKDKVEESYNALLDFLNKKGAKATYTYLIELGFDVSWIMQPKEELEDVKVDKEALFVCGENGI